MSPLAPKKKAEQVRVSNKARLFLLYQVASERESETICKYQVASERKSETICLQQIVAAYQWWGVFIYTGSPNLKLYTCRCSARESLESEKTARAARQRLNLVTFQSSSPQASQQVILRMQGKEREREKKIIERQRHRHRERG